MNTPPSPDELLQERAIDALLTEVHGQATPPDLSTEILRQLGDLRTSANARSKAKSTSDSGIHVTTVSRPRKQKSNYGSWIAATAAVAATIMLAIWIRGGNEDSVAQVDDGTDQGELAASSPDETAIADFKPSEILPGELRRISPTDNGPDQPTVADVSEPAKGTPMIVKGPAPDSSTAPEPAVRPTFIQRSGSAPPVETVAKQLADDWKRYWLAIGITPAEDAPAHVVANRLSQTLGSTIAAKSLSNPEQLQKDLATDVAAKSIMQRWLGQVSGGGTNRLPADVRADLVNEVATAVVSQTGFDAQFVGLLAGESENSSAFYNAMMSADHHSVVRQLGMVTMNVDLRCTRCHDALIKGNGSQDAYWSFAGFLKQGLQRNGGTWKVLDNSELKNKSTFYELPDGRQKYVEPAVDATWMSSSLGQTGEDIQQWSNHLAGSRDLAHGLVNSVWRLVHGRPLHGDVVDAISAPHNEILQKIEKDLAQDLIDSNFDLTRLLSFAMTSPVARRSVPDALLEKNALTASDDEIHEAMELVNAFAASLPDQSKMSVSKRVGIAMKSVGRSIQNLNGIETLANIAPLSGGKKPVRSPRLPEVTGYPYKAAGLPVQWLGQIDSYESQVKHLGYLAGMSDLPKPLLQAAREIRSGDDDSLALTRVWWMLGH